LGKVMQRQSLKEILYNRYCMRPTDIQNNGDLKVEYSRSAIQRERAMQRRRRRAITLGVCATVLVVGAVVLIVALSGGNGNIRKVPMVVGLTYAQARQLSVKAKLKIEVNPEQDYKSVADLDRHRVVDQEPADGKDAEAGTLLRVTLKGVPDAKTASAPTSQPENPQTTTPPQTATSPDPAPTQVAPVDGNPVYPFTKDGSIACGHWPSGSTDYPYFGAPRENGRLHGAIDVYPPTGKGTPVKAIKDGTVVQVIPDFYTRADGEVCCGILIDHGDFVAFYGELQSPAALSVGQTVKTGKQIGAVSGTIQLHFEMYTPGTRARGNWYGSQPSNLLDPTAKMLDLLK